MPTRLVTAPEEEPLTLDEAKTHLRLEATEDDAFVEACITGARQWAEEHLWRGLVTQEWELVVPEFPCTEDGLELPKGNLTADLVGDPAPSSPIVSVKYLDPDGALQTLATTEYEVDDVNVPGRLRLAYDKSWPSIRSRWNAVRVRYQVGWSQANVPTPIKLALKLLVSQLYENRTPEVTGTIISKVEFAVEALLRPYRLARFQ